MRLAPSRWKQSGTTSKKSRCPVSWSASKDRWAPQTLGVVTGKLAVAAGLIAFEGTQATPPEVPPDLGRAGVSTILRPARSKSRGRSWEAAGLAWVST